MDFVVVQVELKYLKQNQVLRVNIKRTGCIEIKPDIITQDIASL
jgi:hypothetical protein